MRSAPSAGRASEANDQHVVGIVDWLWQYAFEQRASDIHLEPRRDTALVRMRIDGVLNTVYRVPPAVMAAMTSRIKLLGRMDVVERRRPQDGRIKTRTAQGAEVELRLSTPVSYTHLTLPTISPVSAVTSARRLDNHSSSSTL